MIICTSSDSINLKSKLINNIGNEGSLFNHNIKSFGSVFVFGFVVDENDVM